MSCFDTGLRVFIYAAWACSTVLANVEWFASLVLEEILASVKQTPIVAIGLALLTMLGIG